MKPILTRISLFLSILAAAVLASAPPARAAAPLSFATPVVLTTDSASAFDVGDVDGDGHFDIVIVTTVAGNPNVTKDVRIGYGLGNGTFTWATLPVVATRVNRVKIVTLVPGQLPQIAVTTGQPQSIQVFSQSPARTFTNTFNLAVSTEPTLVDATDLHHDGNIVLVVNHPSVQQVIRYDVLHPRFSPQVVAGVPVDAMTNAMLSPPFTDLYACGATYEAFDINGGLTNGIVGTAMTSGDFDEDGVNELITSDKTLTRLIPSSSGNSTPLTFPSVGSGFALAAADIDGDGAPDVIEGDTAIAVFRNRGNATFELPVSVGLNGSIKAVATGDFNEDGKPDIVAIYGGVEYCRNTTANSGPVPPQIFEVDPGVLYSGQDANIAISGVGFAAGAQVDWDGQFIASGFNLKTRMIALVPGVRATVGKHTLTVKLEGGPNSPVFNVPVIALPALSVSPTSLTIHEGNEVKDLQIKIGSAAIAPGIQIDVTSTLNNIVLHGGTTAFIAPGATSAPYGVSSQFLPSGTTGSVTFTIHGTSVSKTVPVTVGLPGLTSLSLNPSTQVTAGGSVGGLVFLTGPAHAGQTVTLKATGAPVTIPASIVVPTGQSSATFSVVTKAVTAPTQLSATATLGDTTQTATILVQPAAAFKLSYLPADIRAGETAQITVTLNAAAPAGGTKITFKSQSPLVTAPAAVTIPAGSKSVTVPSATTGLDIVPTPGIPEVVGLDATVNGITLRLPISLFPPDLASVAFPPGTYLTGTVVTGTATLRGKAPVGGTVVHFSAPFPMTSVEASITISSGQSSGPVRLRLGASDTKLSGLVYAWLTEPLKALNTSYLAYPAPVSINVSPDSILSGGSVTATVYLPTAAMAGGVNVYFTSSATNGGHVTAPLVVHVPQGSTKAMATITTTSSSVAYTGSVTAALEPGIAPVTATFTVTPVAVTQAATSNGQLGVGFTTTLTIYCYGPAPIGGFTVALSSSSSHVHVPAKLVIPAGATHASTSISADASFGSAVLTATGGGATVKTTVVDAQSRR